MRAHALITGCSLWLFVVGWVRRLISVPSQPGDRHIRDRQSIFPTWCILNGEGYFTQRPTRLFTLRGFSSNLLEDRGAFTTGLEFYWPLFNLQRGYKTLPVFLHRMRLGTFVDAGAAGDPIDLDDTLVGAGFELITSLEIGWRRTSSFRIGLGWPVVQPDFLDETGPVFLLQLGNPL